MLPKFTLIISFKTLHSNSHILSYWVLRLCVNFGRDTIQPLTDGQELATGKINAILSFVSGPIITADTGKEEENATQSSKR
jgi:hypothetical protein